MDTDIMTDQTANTAQDNGVGAQYAQIVSVLREVADALTTIDTDQVAPLTVSVTLQPVHTDEGVEVATVDAVAEAIGTAAVAVKMSSGSWHHHAERTWRAGTTRTRVAAFCGVTAPEERAVREEADRLRVEVEELRAQLAERAAAALTPDAEMETHHASR